MQWRAYLDGESFEFGILRVLFPGPEVAVRTDDVGWHLTGSDTEVFTEHVQVKEWAEGLLSRLVACGRMEDSRFGLVKFSGRVHREGESTGVVFVSGTVQVRARVTGRPSGGTGDAPWGDDLRSRADALAATDSCFNEALDWFGASSGLDWFVLYKAYELLEKSAGGPFRNRSGWTKNQESAFKASANLPSVSGANARHAVERGDEPPKRIMTLDEARELVRVALRRWPNGQ